MWPRRRKEKIDQYVMIAAQSVVMPMGQGDLNDCWALDQRCFSDGEAYDRETIRYLLSHLQSVCHKVVSPTDEMMAFVVGMIEPDNTGHVVALGVAPEHRRLGLGRGLMYEVEEGVLRRGGSKGLLRRCTTDAAPPRPYLELGVKSVRLL